MRYNIDLCDGYLRGEMIDRETAEETRAFVAALVSAVREYRVPKVMIVVRSSRPIFKVEEYRLSDTLKDIAAISGLKVALTSDTKELTASQEYIELIARQKGLQFRTFPSEKAAEDWLVGR